MQWAALGDASFMSARTLLCEARVHHWATQAEQSSGHEALRCLDTASVQLCALADPLELLRHVHPSAASRTAAERAMMRLQRSAAQINTSAKLLNALLPLLSDSHRFDVPSVRAARSYCAELRNHAAHLTSDLRSRAALLQTSIADAAYDFACAPHRIDTLRSLLALRCELAALLGHSSFAHLATAHGRVLDSPARVLAFLDSVATRVAPIAEHEARVLRDRRKSHWADDAMLAGAAQTGVTLSHVLQALRGVTEDQLKIPVKDVALTEDEDVWAPDVSLWKIGEDSFVYLDLLERPGKMSPEATYMLSFNVATNPSPLGNRCALVCSVANPENLTAREVETLFHEFGHCLAACLSRTTYQQLAGTRVEHDIVEVPSLLLEHMAWDCLQQYTSLPRGAIAAQKQRSAKFPGLRTEGQILIARTDLMLHSFTADKLPLQNSDVENLARSLDNQSRRFPRGPNAPKEPLSFSGHLGSYGAAYYGYLLAQTFAANVASNCPSLSVYADKVLRYAGERDPVEALRDCCGGVDPFSLEKFI